jgi:hypothetical protein
LDTSWRISRTQVRSEQQLAGHEGACGHELGNA